MGGPLPVLSCWLDSVVTSMLPVVIFLIQGFWLASENALHTFNLDPRGGWTSEALLDSHM